MQPQVALNILTEATANLSANRQQHALIAQALQVLGQLVNIPITKFQPEDPAPQEK